MATEIRSYKVYTLDARGTQGTRGFVYAGTVEARNLSSAMRKAKRSFPHQALAFAGGEYSVEPEGSGRLRDRFHTTAVTRFWRIHPKQGKGQE